jgi:hypothetical protein
VSALELKPTVQVGGRDWRLFDIAFQTADGEYSVYMYALSFEHAQMMLDELKQTARVAGQVEGFYPS